MPPKKKPALGGKSLLITFHDEDEGWVRDAAVQLGATLETSVSPNLDYIVGSTFEEVANELGSSETNAALVSKSFLLDVIASSKLPSSIEPYLLSNSTVSSTSNAKPKSVLEDDLLAPRKSSAKRKNQTEGESTLEEPNTKRKASEPSPSSSITTTKPIIEASSTSGANKGANKNSSELEGPHEPPFPKIPSISVAGSAKIPNYNEVTMSWSRKAGAGLLVFSSEELPGRSCIASFDMDHTLILPKSGAKFPANRNDWRWAWPEVPEMLKKLHSLGFKIVIFSNQKGISGGQQKESDITGKIQDMCSAINVPMQAFCATASDEFRKPSPSMFRLFASSYNKGVSIDLEKSFYIGDAAGRAANWAPKKKSDHGVGDRKFAANNRIAFQTPEEFFLGEAPAAFNWRSINPIDIITPFASSSSDPKSAQKTREMEAILDSIGKVQELIIMVGLPASGKSTFAERYLVPKGYVRINRDTLGTQQKCQSAVKAALSSGKSAVVDNTNPSVSAREEYIKIAKASGVQVRAFWMQTSETIADHCNLYREKQKGIKHIPNIAYNMYRKNFAAPHASEGIQDIIKVPWIPKFDSNKDHSMFLQWTE